MNHKIKKITREGKDGKGVAFEIFGKSMFTARDVKGYMDLFAGLVKEEPASDSSGNRLGEAEEAEVNVSGVADLASEKKTEQPLKEKDATTIGQSPSEFSNPTAAESHPEETTCNRKETFPAGVHQPEPICDRRDTDAVAGKNSEKISSPSSDVQNEAKAVREETVCPESLSATYPRQFSVRQRVKEPVSQKEEAINQSSATPPRISGSFVEKALKQASAATITGNFSDQFLNDEDKQLCLSEPFQSEKTTVKVHEEVLNTSS